MSDHHRNASEESTTESFEPLDNYGLVGNLETCALVNRQGSVDWFPIPHLESGSVFSRLLDADSGGRFSIRPTAAFDSRAKYYRQTNVIESTFRTDGGTVTVTDWMVPLTLALDGVPNQALYRRVSCQDGAVEVDITFEPRFDFARGQTALKVTDDGIVATGERKTVLLWTTDSDRFSVDTGATSATATISLAATSSGGWASTTGVLSFPQPSVANTRSQKGRLLA